MSDPTPNRPADQDDAAAPALERISSIPPKPAPILVAELYEDAPAERYLDKLLRAMVVHRAAHAQVVLRGAKPWTRYHIAGAYRDPHLIPAHVAVRLEEELRLLVSVSDSSCPDDQSHTFRIDLPTVGVRFFRIHERGHVLILTRIEAAWASRRTEIIDRNRRLAQERLVVRGQLAMNEARNDPSRWPDAIQAFEAAVELGEGIERPAWLTRVLIQIGRAQENMGSSLKAEMAYKRAAGLIEARYSRQDAQRLRLFSSLARCARRRGDRDVEAMWQSRADQLRAILMAGI